MRWVMPQPCIGSRARVLRMSRSNVPCKRSDFGLVMTFLQISWRKDTRLLVDGQEKKRIWAPIKVLRVPRVISTAPQKLDEHTRGSIAVWLFFLQTALGVILPGLLRFGIGEGADQGFSVGERGQAGAHRARDGVDVFFSNN